MEPQGFLAKMAWFENDEIEREGSVGVKANS
jgi:hypothetical protein